MEWYVWLDRANGQEYLHSNTHTISHRPYICEFSFICDFLKFTENFAKNMAYN